MHCQGMSAEETRLAMDAGWIVAVSADITLADPLVDRNLWYRMPLNKELK